MNIHTFKTVSINGLLFFLICLFPFLQSFSNVQKDSISPSEIYPLEVDVTIRINKIYNINSVHETYQIDGYFLTSWRDESVKDKFKDSLSESIIFEHKKDIKLISNELWIPVFEFINVHGSRETANRRIELFSDGTIEYEERFFATLYTNMNFRPFPFDTQKYLIKIEACSYDKSKLIFKESYLFPKLEQGKHLGEDWTILSQKDTITSEPYSYSKKKHNETSYYSRVTMTIEAERLPGYYVWQVLFPLLIIILASFTIFWIKEFGTQIGVGFTLMLTVVAFNFYSAAILPKLPYNTFIEYVIIVGYIFIFLGIVAVIINHRVNDVDNKKEQIPLLKHFRYAFPLVYAIIMTILYINFIAF